MPQVAAFIANPAGELKALRSEVDEALEALGFQPEQDVPSMKARRNSDTTSPR